MAEIVRSLLAVKIAAIARQHNRSLGTRHENAGAVPNIFSAREKEKKE